MNRRIALLLLALALLAIPGSEPAQADYPPDYSRVVMFFNSKAPYYTQQFAIVTQLRNQGYNFKLVNIALHPDIAAHYGVTVSPTYFGLYGNYTITGRINGVATYAQLLALSQSTRR